MNPLLRLADAAAQRDIKQAKASRDKWRKLAELLGAKLRTVTAASIRLHGHIGHQNRLLQDQGRELAKLRQHLAVCRIELAKMRQHLAMCRTAEAVAGEDQAKRMADL